MTTFSPTCGVYRDDRKDFCGYPVGHCDEASGEPSPHSWQPEAHPARSVAERNNPRRPSVSGIAVRYTSPIPVVGSTNFAMVREFNRMGEVETSGSPSVPTYQEYALGSALIKEEFKELDSAFLDADLIEFADALGDILYVVYRLADVAGIPIDEVFAEIHRSNMTKFPGGKIIRREDGKILKPPTWEAPKIREILEKYGTA